MFEPQPLRGVVELDVDAEVVRVELQLVPGHEAALLVDVHLQPGDLAVDGKPPVPVRVRMPLECDRCGGGHVLDCLHGFNERQCCVDICPAMLTRLSRIAAQHPNTHSASAANVSVKIVANQNAGTRGTPTRKCPALASPDSE